VDSTVNFFSLKMNNNSILKIGGEKNKNERNGKTKVRK
jgi:hypothetical protein